MAHLLALWFIVFSQVFKPLSVLGATDAPPPAPEQIQADWLRQDEKRHAGIGEGRAVTREEDASGGVDGIKDGKWGFHTENEVEPWWQVDLGRSFPLERVVLWNRCDGMAGRNSRIRVLVSENGKVFEQVYQHDGSVFYGHSDGKPLVVRIGRKAARYVRLTLPGKDYFHLDEVEIYAVGKPENLALVRPATQSSVSQWSAKHASQVAQSAREYPITRVVDRGLKLAASQRRLGAAVAEPERVLREVSQAATQLPADASDSARSELYFRAHWAIRQMALGNPRFAFDSLLFVKRAPGMFPHMSDQHYGWWSRGGGGIYRLDDFKSKAPRLRCLTSDLPEGSFIGPDVSWDGKQILFAYCKFYPHLADERNKADKSHVPEDAFYHLFVMNADGTERRQLTHGKYDDFDPRWLPNGDLVFLSTRKGLAIQCSQAFSDSTREADLPDSYVRCGGDNARPVPVFTLHATSGDGRDIRPLSAFENFEWAPAVASDGRLLYTRWDYIDRFNGHFFSLWSANQDGTNPQLVYGNYTVKPQVVVEARSIPGSAKLVFTASAHHSITGGTLCLLDRAQGTEGDAPLTRLTPDVRFPETEGNDGHYYANPWPLSEDYFLVSWSDQALPPHCRATEEQNPRNATGIYLLDAFGNQELLYRDPALSSAYPMPLAPRQTPPVQSSLTQWTGAQEGNFLVQDVYRGLDGVPCGAVKSLRIVAVPPKVQPHMNNPVLGVSAEDPGKFVLGTVPVESDGSAHFRVPSCVPLLLQALDERGLAVQTMRSLTYVMPGQTLACVGCHEHRDAAPPMDRPALAATRPPAQITSGPAGSWPLRFDQLVQPVLDRHCVSCHSPDSRDANASALALTPAKSWNALLTFGGEDLKKLAFERDRSVTGQGTAANSKLWKLLAAPAGHYAVKLDADSLNRLATWMDTYAQRVGHFSDAQERELARFREQMRLAGIVAGPPAQD